MFPLQTFNEEEGEEEDAEEDAEEKGELYTSRFKISVD